MRSISKLILSAVAILAGIPLLLSLVLSLCLLWPGAKESIAMGLKTSLPLSLRIGGAYVLPWGDLLLTRLETRQDNCIAEARSATVTPSLWALVHGTFMASRFSVRNASFQSLDHFSRPVVTLSGVTFSGNGTLCRLHVRNAVIGASLKLHHIDAQGTLQENSLLIDHLSAQLGGGCLNGTVFCGPLSSPSMQYRTHWELSEAKLDELMADALIQSAAAKGSVNASLSLEGIAGETSSMNGHGEILAKEVTIQPMNCLRQIGNILSIQELQMLHLSQAKGLFTVTSGNITVNDLSLISDNLVFSAKGSVESSGTLNLQSRLLFNDRLTSRLQGLLGKQLTKAPEEGFSQLAFHVYGSAADPRTDLLERITGIRIGGNMGVLNNLLQGLFPPPPPPALR